jgi:pimeloyl-ACP methyl ester carboxylesterase
MKRLLFALVYLAIGLFAQAQTSAASSETDMVLKTATGDIYGTLTIADNSKPTPIVLIIAGSGPTDRNGNSPMGVKACTYQMLSQDLAKNGIASLRFDKRGIGQSKAAMTSESDLRFETYIKDVTDWISLLKSDKRFSSIIVLGHSEGSLIGMIAAGQSKMTGFISIAGAGKSADKIIQEQLKKQLPMTLLGESNQILDSLKAGKTVAKVNPTLASLYRPSVQPYMISWIKYDPAKEIRRLKIPVMIIQGTTDLQVTVEDAKLLSAAKPDAKLLIMENMNHVLKEAEADVQKNMATYNDPALPLKAGLIEKIVQFIKGKNKK